MKAIENTVKIIERVEKTHKNLGVPLVFCKVVDLANLGCFLVASRGKGKTTVLKTLADKLRHRDVLVISSITYAGLKNLSRLLSNNSLTLINKDFSSFYSDYLKDVGVGLIASLITDHTVRSSTGTYKVSIVNCYVSFLSATQPQMIRSLSKLPTWESMYKDRFLRFYMLYTRGSPKYVPYEPDVPQVEINTEVDTITIPSSIRKDYRYRRMLRIFQEQTSEGRCRLHLDTLLKAHAALNCRDAVVTADLDFLSRCALFLVMDYLLSERASVSSPPIFDDDAYTILEYMMEHGEVSRKKLREYFRVSHATIMRDMQPLIAKGIIKGTFGADKYRITERFYDKYIKPIHNFYKEVGIE